MVSALVASNNITHLSAGLTAVGVGIGFFAQSIVGFSAGAIAFPILLLVINIQEANAIFGTLLVLFSIIMVWKNREDIDRSVFLDLLAGTVVGMILGIVLLKHVHPVILNKLLGLITLGYAAYTLLKQKPLPWISRLGWLFGFLGGLLGGLFSTGSPAQIMYINNKIHAGRAIRATVMAIVGVGNVIRIPIMWYEHLLTEKTLILSAIALPAFIVALYAGHKLYHTLDEKIFKQLVVGFLAVAGLLLIIK